MARRLSEYCDAGEAGVVLPQPLNVKLVSAWNARDLEPLSEQRVSKPGYRRDQKRRQTEYQDTLEWAVHDG